MIVMSVIVWLSS